MEQLKEFVMKYFKLIVVVLSFSLTLYIQHVNNTAQIAELETKMYRFGSGNQEPV